VSFRLKLFFSFVLLGVLVVAGSVFTVNNQFARTIQEDVYQELARSTERFASFQATAMHSLITEAANISTSHLLRGAMSTTDRPTIMQAAEETSVLYGYDLFWILDERGTALHRVDQPNHWGDQLDHLPLIQDVRYGYDSGDIWLVDGKLFHVAAAGIQSGNQLLGMVVIGESYKDHVCSEFAQMTRLEIAFAPGAEVGMTSLDDLNGFQLLNEFKTQTNVTSVDELDLPAIPWSRIGPDARIPNAPTFQFSNEGTIYAGALFRLNGVQNQLLAYGMVFRSLDTVQALQRSIRSGLISVGVGAMVLALFVSYLLTRGLLKPINDLVDASKRLGHEDLETPVPVISGDEIGVLSQALEDMRISLKDARAEALRNERLSTIGRMASTITHDFRQPITSIYGYIQLITLPSANRSTQQEFAQRIIKQIDRMQGMISELLDYSKGDWELKSDEIHISNFLNQIKSNFGIVSRDQRINIEIETKWDGVILADAGRFERVLDNLISNAMQAIESNGSINVKTIKAGDDMVLTISDDGPGIPEDIRETLFDPFVTHGKTGGTGLGLAVSKKVVEEHGGTLKVESKHDSGSTFTIRIPIILPKEG
jgi:signal transduction histidine kinase